MSETERRLHRRDIADLYVQTARRFKHSAILVHHVADWGDPTDELVLDVWRSEGSYAD